MGEEADRIDSVRAWALSRIAECRRQEAKFGAAWHDQRPEDECLSGCHLGRAKEAEAEVERLRTVLRSLISCGGTSANIRATAMNTLEAGSGDAWLATRRQGTETNGEG